MIYENALPDPEFLIKSIAEQGYSLETSIADIIDNSISAKATRIEVLIDTSRKPFTLFIADNGHGMTESQLRKNLQFPSSSVEDKRPEGDLGRFGLGLKTASFSQSRRFTVISRRKNTKSFFARTWDVMHLKKKKKWQLIVDSDNEISELLSRYQELSDGFLNSFSDFKPNTVVIWQGLYKFENDAIASTALQKELTEITKEYLQLIFHRFLERSEPVLIRLNNDHLKPFNPFPKEARTISLQQKLLVGDKLKLEGFILPNRSIAESKEGSQWTLSHKSLMDMEGLYVYRADRIIVYGGWNGLIQKSPRLQLARLKVEIGNGIDDIFHLNVAKSSIAIPFSERIPFIRYVSLLKKEAEKEYFNHAIKSTSGLKANNASLFKKSPSTHGIQLEIDMEFPLVKHLSESLSRNQRSSLKLIFRMVSTMINKIKRVHGDQTFTTIMEKDGINEEDVTKAIALLIEGGVSKNDISDEIISTLGIDKNSIPGSILSLLS